MNPLAQNGRIFCMILSIISIHTRMSAQAGPADLRCEHLSNPIGVDAPHPRLSWKIADEAQSAKQTAYQVSITTDTTDWNKTSLVWNTGKIVSSKNLILYAGKELHPFTRYYWKVNAWDKDGKASYNSRINYFETGMMNMRNWKGNWISDGNNIQTLPAPYFRKQFIASKKIREARAYIVAAGLFELFINGEKTGDHRLDPMYTRFDRRNLYLTHDITDQLKAGSNAIGVILGNGWYNHQSIAVWNFDRAPWRQRPAFCMDLHITYEDGTKQIISTDASWKTSTGPIVMNSIYTGEHYDSRLQIPGWGKAGFDDSKWKNAVLRAAPSTNIVSQLMTPIRNVQQIHPASFKKFSDTNYVFDIGRNIAGVTKIKLRGDSGTVVRIIHGERIFKATGAAGHVDLSNINVYHRPKDDSDPFQTDIVILNGKDGIEFMPEFNYKGFRYVEIKSSKPVDLSANDLTACFMHSDVGIAGNLHSSNPLINGIWEATNNSYLSNLYGYPTDCPQREKNGWTGDGHFAVESGLFNFDAITVYEKWLADHRDEQQPNGVLPDIIPTGGWGYGDANGTDWTSTIAIIPWNLYLFYGDTTALSANYNNIRSYVNYIEQISSDGLTTFGRGDWVPVKTSSNLEFTSSIYFYVDADILAKTAMLLGRKDDQVRYRALADKIKKSLNDKYFDSTRQIYAGGSQTELSMALHWKIVPPEQIPAVAENLAKRVISDGLHIDVGVLGAKAVLNALSDNGQAEIAYKLAAQNTYPSWGWWIVNGATTLYENWDINATRDISDNHMMFGEIGAWLYKGLAGIKPDESQPGFKNVLLHPNFVTGLTEFSAWHEGPYGIITSKWVKEKRKIIYEVSVPANSTASIKWPAGLKSITLGKKQINAENVLQIESGHYTFELK